MNDKTGIFSALRCEENYVVNQILEISDLIIVRRNKIIDRFRQWGMLLQIIRKSKDITRLMSGEENTQKKIYDEGFLQCHFPCWQSVFYFFFFIQFIKNFFYRIKLPSHMKVWKLRVCYVNFNLYDQTSIFEKTITNNFSKKKCVFCMWHFINFNKMKLYFPLGGKSSNKILVFFHPVLNSNTSLINCKQKLNFINMIKMRNRQSDKTMITKLQKKHSF